MTRAIVLAELAGKTRPVLVLTRRIAQPCLNQVTVAPVTSTVRGIATEVVVDQRNGLGRQGVANCDTIVSIPKELLGDTIGFLLAGPDPHPPRDHVPRDTGGPRRRRHAAAPQPLGCGAGAGARGAATKIAGRQ
ncbi:MAG: type II toxin-antitoxin system PemK/MazF family toxin [Bifidobacteriaceae bacterium]|nr:type II toxin-antitoxin system PemK/MazF family toxin [Bifidobacteriaceae bacterium]